MESKYRHILVHLDDTDRAGPRLDLAIDLARAHDAHLTGLYVIPPPNIPLYVEVELPVEYIEREQAHARSLAERAKKLFNDRAGKSGLSVEWRQADGDPVELVSLHARYADISVLGQGDPDHETAASPADLAELVALAAGRPVLVVPYAGVFKNVGSRVLVAWNAGRESTRAVNDAIPILARAQQVTVLAINPKRGSTGHGEVPSADISLHLARHGVKVSAAQTVASDIDVGDVILSRLSDMGVDLLVMGAYGHSRFREIALGGVTRHVFKHMTVPVLASH